MVLGVSVDEFLEETQDILTDLGRGCTEIRAGGDARELRPRLELGLHTIKGNASAFEFHDLAGVASDLLELVRRRADASDANDPWEVALLMEFITRTRRYVGFARDGKERPDGYFDGLQRAVGESLETGAAPARKEAPASDPHVDLRKILARAPKVHPDISELSRLASMKLGAMSSPNDGEGSSERPPARAPSQEKSAPTERAPRAAPAPAAARNSTARAGSAPRTKTPATSSAPASADLAERSTPQTSRPRLASDEETRTDAAALPPSLPSDFDSDARAQLDALAAPLAASLDLARTIGRASDATEKDRVAERLVEALEQMHRRVADARGVRLREILSSLRSESGKAIAIEGDTGTVDPLVAELVRRICETALAAVSLTARELGIDVELRLGIDRDSQRHSVHIRGVRLPRGPASNLRLFPIRRRLQDFGGSIEVDTENASVTLSLPNDLCQLTVVEVRAGQRTAGIPRHCVLGHLPESSCPIAGQGSERTCTYEGRETRLFDLTIGDAKREREVVFSASGTEAVALLVDEWVATRDVIVRPATAGSGGCETTGLVVGDERDEKIPILGLAPR